VCQLFTLVDQQPDFLEGLCFPSTQAFVVEFEFVVSTAEFSVGSPELAGFRI
jgi:hypothetical protein